MHNSPSKPWQDDSEKVSFAHLYKVQGTIEKVVTLKYRHMREKVAILEVFFHICYLIFTRNEQGTHKPLVGSPNLPLGTQTRPANSGGFWFRLRCICWFSFPRPMDPARYSKSGTEGSVTHRSDWQVHRHWEDRSVVRPIHGPAHDRYCKRLTFRRHESTDNLCPGHYRFPRTTGLSGNSGSDYPRGEYGPAVSWQPCCFG